MNTSDTKWLLDKLLNEEICPKGTKWYLFGSCLNGDPKAKDIDILVVYSSPKSVKEIRKRIQPLELQRPMDIIYMSEDEERELSFIQSEFCVEIYPDPRFFTE